MSLAAQEWPQRYLMESKHFFLCNCLLCAIIRLLRTLGENGRWSQRAPKESEHMQRCVGIHTELCTLHREKHQQQNYCCSLPSVFNSSLHHQAGRCCRNTQGGWEVVCARLITSLVCTSTVHSCFQGGI